MSPLPTDLVTITHYLSRRCFVEAAYFGTLSALRTPTAEAHLVAGAACCGCVHPLATAQRLFEGEAVGEEELGTSSLRVAPVSELPYEGFFHLIQALRLDSSIQAPYELHQILTEIAEDLVFVSRRELERPPDSGRRHTLSASCIAAAVLLTRITGDQQALSRIPSHKVNSAQDMIEAELTRVQGDAAFLIKAWDEV